MTLEELEIVVKADVEEASKKLEELKAQIEDISNSDEAQKTFQDISTSADEMGETAKKSADDLGLLEQVGGGALEGLLKKLKFTKAESGEVATALSQIGTSMGSLLSILGVASVVIGSLVVGTMLLIAQYKIIIKLIKAMFSPAITVMTKLLKGLAKVIKQEVTQAIQTLKRKASDGINNLVQVSNSLNEALSSLKSNLTQTGNAIATAVAPVLEAIIPLMNEVLNTVINVANGIAQVTASLFGNAKTFKKATKVNEDYAKSVNGVSKANKGMLASFDELNVISEQDSGAGGVNPEDMFTTEVIDEKIQAFTSQLKDLWESNNIEGLENFGANIGRKINEQIEKLPTYEWGKNIGSQINKALALANGFLSTNPRQSNRQEIITTNIRLNRWHRPKTTWQSDSKYNQ